MAIFSDRAITAKVQNGLYDPCILCFDCDSTIGVLDKWFIDQLTHVHDVALQGPSYVLKAVDVDPLSALRFAVSVIYRASISRREPFAQISLGKYTEAAGNIAVLGMRSGIESPLVLMNVLTSDTLDTRQFAFYPVRCAGDNGPYFVFTLSGVQFLVKFGGRHDGVSSEDRLSPTCRLLPGRRATICPYPFDESAEAGFLRTSKKSNDKRGFQIGAKGP
jgi:hypothetical protein